MIKNVILALLVGALFTHMWFLLPYIYATAAQAPNDVTGQVWPLNNHGTTVYVTRAADLARSVATPVLFAACFVTFLVSVLPDLLRKSAHQPAKKTD